LIYWEPLPPLEPGCTAIIGMCSRLPYVLGANLYCLNNSQWEYLKEVIITVDAEKGALPEGFEDEIIQKFPQLNVTFFYYNRQQAEFTAKIGDPFIYSWLSWAICLNHVRTKTVLIQDYDALVLGKNALERRYRTFLESEAKIQGVVWYKSNGFVTEDHITTTFEALIDPNWIRAFPPIMGYNRVGLFKGRKIDYDTYLDIQANHTPENQITMIPMSLEELVHPSQMITQYMRFKKSPGKALPCFSVIMTPFFYFLSGQENAITNATQALKRESPKRVDLLRDGVLINLSLLNTKTVDWIMKNIIQVLVKEDIKPFRDIIDYGTALYQVCKTPEEQIWVGDFTDAQREWIEAAKGSFPK
jgi:hypothetical protein